MGLIFMSKKGTTPRTKRDANRARHETLCTVCKHEGRKGIEADYIAFTPSEHTAQSFGVSRNAVMRHCEFFGLDAERVADTKKVLKHIVARGFSQLKKVDSKLLIESVKELNKMDGKHQEPMPNQNLTLEEKASRAAELINQSRQRMRLVK